MMNQRIFSVLDFGADSVLVLFAKKENQRLEILGGGEARTGGFNDGRLVNMADAVESVKEAIEKAQRSCGMKVERLYCYYDDPGIKCVAAQGCKNLDTDSPIRQADVEDSLKTAQRFLFDYEQTLIYAKDLFFIVDDKDRVLDPVGIYGRKLEVFMMALTCPTDFREVWMRIFKRSFIPRVNFIPSVLASAGAVISPTDESKVIFWDLGRDYLNGCVLAGERVFDVQVFVTGRAMKEGPLTSRIVETSKHFLKTQEGIKECVITGDLCADPHCAEAIQKDLLIPVTTRSPKGYDKLEQPGYAALVGLLLMAEKIERKDPQLFRKRDLIGNLKEKTIAFISDYF